MVGNGKIRVVNKVSVITPTFNNPRTLKDTFHSVLLQNYPNLEYILVDGAGDTETVSLVDEYSVKFAEAGISFTYICEPDEGIYDAINKGIDKSTGVWIGIINSDDYYQGNILNELFIEGKYSADILYGNLNLLNYQRNVIKTVAPKKINSLLNEMGIFHPATFVKKKIYSQYGQYDCKFSLAADYKFLVEMYLSGLEFKYIDHTFASYDTGGATGNGIIRSWREVREIQKELGFSKISYNANFLSLLIKRLLLNCMRRFSKKND